MVYVQPFSATGAKYEISHEAGGRHPVWSRDGIQMLFVMPGRNRYAVATVTTRPAFSSTNSEPLTRVFEDSLADPFRSFDIAADGRLLGVIGADQAQLGTLASQIQVVPNWTEELKARVPAK